jgi:prepilin-type processing-associated H-X9-DG protein
MSFRGTFMAINPINPAPTREAAETPERITATARGASLALSFADGGTQLIAAERLRLACRCAHCTRGRVDGVFPESFGGITIETISPMGNYAINVGFSDGHARGVYPWSYLALLAQT